MCPGSLVVTISQICSSRSAFTAAHDSADLKPSGSRVSRRRRLLFFFEGEEDKKQKKKNKALKVNCVFSKKEQKTATQRAVAQLGI